ncbi:hypothetical protein MMC14_001535 [Varicellaria rhodocarpa]|nr:hypothetical protein [Varicellaria rhodocarpa]
MPEQRYTPLSSNNEKPLPPLPSHRIKWLIAVSATAVCIIVPILFWTSPVSIRFSPPKWISKPYVLTSLDPNLTTVITTFEHPTKYSGSPPEDGGAEDPWDLFLHGKSINPPHRNDPPSRKAAEPQ